MAIFKVTFPLLAICSFFQYTEGAIEGRVTDSAGKPVLRAWIYPSAGGSGAYTDAGGYFNLADISPPTILVVFHREFRIRKVEVLSERSLPVLIELASGEGLSEEITVTAPSRGTSFSPVGAAASLINPGEMNAPASSLVELLESVPGLSENGQGGHLRTFSIRGVSRHRIRTSIGGVRLAGERRAGVSASFLDPFLIGSIELSRGPSVVHHGSGALGGVAEILPRRFEGWDIGLGYRSQGNENYLQSGWGQDGWSVGFVRRNASNATAPNGTELNTHFTQYSGAFSKLWTGSKREYQVFLIPTLGNDIGKSSSDFPGRTTNYPRERHLLVGVSTQSSTLWKIEAFLHPHDLTTRVTESKGQSNVLTNSLDFGGKASKQFLLGSRSIVHLGADYFGRRGVDSEERRFSESLHSLEDAAEDELGLLATLSVQLRRVLMEAGGRFTYFAQNNGQDGDVSDRAFNGYASFSVPIELGFELSGSVGSGLRFPSLSERFFQGTTGRGSVIGNPLLNSERALNTDLGFRFHSRKVFASSYYFYNRISDYIERLDVNDSLYTFINLTRGTIQGFEWETALAPQEATSLYFRGHLLRGRDNQGAPLTDIPVRRFTVGFQREQNSRFEYGAEWQFRGRKSNPGSGERRIDSAGLLSAFLGFRPAKDFRTSLALNNIMNDLYYPAADRSAAFAPGRAVSVRIDWLPD